MLNGPKKLILDVSGPGEIKAKKITENPDIEILNPELTICNLDEGTKFHMELTVNSGKGYVPANLNKIRRSTIRIDSNRLFVQSCKKSILFS